MATPSLSLKDTPESCRSSRPEAIHPGANLLLHGTQVARPHVHRVAKEVLSCRGLGGEELAEAAVPFAYVAGPTGGHYVSARMIAATGARLHVIDAQRVGGKDLATVDAPIRIAREELRPLHSGVPVTNPLNPRRFLLDTAKKIFEDDEAAAAATDVPPRLTGQALHALPTLRMSRSREKILENLDEMYREAFERAQASGDHAQQATLDFAYRREQLYFEILLDVRDAVERR